MRKLFAGMLAVSAAFSACISASAYEYSPVYFGKDAVVEDIPEDKVNPTEFQTVVVTRVADSEGNTVSTDLPVYVDQDDDSFATGLKLMLLNEPALAQGTYEITFGNESGTNAELYFYVGDFAIAKKDIMTVADDPQAEEGKVHGGVQYYKKGFTLENISFDSYNEYKSVKLVSADGSTVYGAFALGGDVGEWNTKDENETTFTGEGQMTVGIQVYSIPDEFKDLVLYFSTDEVVAVEGGEQ